MPIGEDEKVFSKLKYQQTRAFFEKTDFAGFKVPPRDDDDDDDDDEATTTTTMVVTEAEKVVDVIDAGNANIAVANQTSTDTSDAESNVTIIERDTQELEVDASKIAVVEAAEADVFTTDLTSPPIGLLAKKAEQDSSLSSESKPGDSSLEFEMDFPELERAFPEGTAEPILKQRFKKSVDKDDDEQYILSTLINNNNNNNNNNHNNNNNNDEPVLEKSNLEYSSSGSSPYSMYLIELVQCASALAAGIILWKTCF